MPLVEVASAEDPRLDPYRILRDPELVRTSDAFVAEGRLVVRVLLERSPLVVRSLLLTTTALEALQQDGTRLPGDVPVYVGAPGLLEDLAGFRFHQGCLALGERPSETSVEVLVAERAPRRVVVLERVSNPDNVGAIARTAAALGGDALVLSPDCASPLYRKAIRASLGATLRLPFAQGSSWPEALGVLRQAGFHVAALTPRGEADVRDLGGRAPVALLLGSEGHGLSEPALAAADGRYAVPMAEGEDSLNVNAAAAIALHVLAS